MCQTLRQLCLPRCSSSLVRKEFLWQACRVPRRVCSGSSQWVETRAGQVGWGRGGASCPERRSTEDAFLCLAGSELRPGGNTRPRRPNTPLQSSARCCVLEIGTAAQWASGLQQMQGLFIALWQNVRFGSSTVQAWHVAFVFSLAPRWSRLNSPALWPGLWLWLHRLCDLRQIALRLWLPHLRSGSGVPPAPATGRGC